jgi:hypothetical protein
MGARTESNTAGGVDKLAAEAQAQVPGRARSRKGKRVTEAALLRFVGRIPEDELRQIEAAIEEDFEQVHDDA